MAAEAKSTLHVFSTTCAACGGVVGLIWFKGRSTLIDGPIDSDGANLIAKRHQCPGAPTRPKPRPGRSR